MNDDIPVDQWSHKVRRRSIRQQGPTTICYADLCRYAEGCPNKTLNPRRIPEQRCPRYWPEELRPPATNSEYVQRLLDS